MTDPDTVIRAEGLGKRYPHRPPRPSAKATSPFANVIVRNIRNLGRSAVDLIRGRPNVPAMRSRFWALREVSFEIRRGEVVGIIWSQQPEVHPAQDPLAHHRAHRGPGWEFAAASLRYSR